MEISLKYLVLSINLNINSGFLYESQTHPSTSPTSTQMSTVIESGKMQGIIQIGIKWYILWQIGGCIHLYICKVTVKKKELEREIQILTTFPPSNTWSIAAWSGHECRIVVFGKLRKLSNTVSRIPKLEMWVERGFQMLFGHPTSTSDEAYWPLSALLNIGHTTSCVGTLW